MHFLLLICSYHNILTKMLNSNMQYRSNYQWKGLYRLLLLMSPYAVPLSLLLSSCASRVRVAATGEVAKNTKHLKRQGQVSFYYLLKHTPFALKILYLTVSLFVATFRIHADDDNSPLFPYPLPL